jgi:hypothetical protein
MMRDLHVVALYYRLETDTSLAFDHPPPLMHDTDACTLHLAEGVLTCTMKGHDATADEARARVYPHLRSWELAEALSHGRHSLWFTFDRAEIIDRDPPPPETSRVLYASPGEFVMLGEDVRLCLTHPSYPPPPMSFIASPDVETLWNRYEGYTQGREPLPGMVYFCQSFIEKVLAEGQADAADKYRIERKVLRALGNLHSHRGDLTNRRKLELEQDRYAPSLTPSEIAWMEAAVRMLIRRIGEYAADSTTPWPMLSMRDLPPL